MEGKRDREHAIDKALRDFAEGIWEWSEFGTVPSFQKYMVGM